MKVNSMFPAQTLLRLIGVSLLAAPLLTACVSAPKAGVSDVTLFRAQPALHVIESARSATAWSQCFRDRANLLPLSEFGDTGNPGEVRYSLRVYGESYEEIVFTPRGDAGSSAEVRLAPNLKDKWRRDFASARMAALQTCAEER